MARIAPISRNLRALASRYREILARCYLVSRLLALNLIRWLMNMYARIVPTSSPSRPHRTRIASTLRRDRTRIAPGSRLHRASIALRACKGIAMSQRKVNACIDRTNNKQQTTNHACLHRAQLMHDSTTSHWPHKMPSNFNIAIRHRVNVGKDRARIALDACLGIALCTPCQSHMCGRECGSKLQGRNREILTRYRYREIPSIA